jgi:hypothetical protein
MKKKIYTFAAAIFLAVFFLSSAWAQNFVTHETGTITVSVFDNSYIGHNYDASAGSGVLFGGPDAMYTSGLVLGYSLTRSVGLVGSFTDGTSPVMNDWANTSPFGPIGSSFYFNQIASTSYDDANAPADNRVGVSVEQRSLSNSGSDYIILEYTITNTSGADISGLYVGIFADWDVGAANYALNRGGYDESRGLTYQYENGGAADSRYYGIAALTGMAGARVTANSAFGGGGGPVRDSVFHWISTFMDEPIAANGDYRTFIGSGPFDVPNNGSFMVGFAVLGGDDLTDLQANTDEAQSTWDNFVLPVELTSFTASAGNGSVTLNWSTATEINNMMFEIERKEHNGKFIRIGFVNGAGTTTEEKTYSFTDHNVNSGKYVYRLKQIDFSGEYEYSNEVEVDATAPVDFALAQNFPNPFNPSTEIAYSIADAGMVKLSIYNLLGEKIATVVNDFKAPGSYSVSFDASGFTSGTYFYHLQSGQQMLTKKMTIVK